MQHRVHAYCAPALHQACKATPAELDESFALELVVRRAGPGGEVEPEEEAARRRELDEIIGLRALLDEEAAQGARGGEPRWHVRKDTAEEEAAVEAFEEDTVVRATGAAGAAKAAVGEWRELCTYSASTTASLKRESTAHKGRSLSIIADEGRLDPSKIAEAAAGPPAEAKAAAAAAVDAAAEPAAAGSTTLDATVRVAAIEAVGSVAASDAPVQSPPRVQRSPTSLGPECVVVMKPGDELVGDVEVLEVLLTPRSS